MATERIDRVIHGIYITECPPHGFRARCACGWAGPWRGYDVAPAHADAAYHERDCDAD